eukprot:XP_014069096.1 PREDICTED: sperm surface protein Sp17 isoform X7 [Salmo salar]
MSVPFSNTHLRVPRGFGNVLEGLAREVLRDQPKDIPTFAALYFTALLKEREDSGLDPAEWCARLEDRFYNNHAFKNSPNQVNTSPADATLKISNLFLTHSMHAYTSEHKVSVSGNETSLVDTREIFLGQHRVQAKGILGQFIRRLSSLRLLIMDCHIEECSQPQEEEDIMDIPLDDPEANKAAAKIQAGFRGHMTRKKIKPADKPEGEEEDEENQEDRTE